MTPPPDRRTEHRKGRNTIYEPTADPNSEEFGDVEAEMEGLPANQWAVQWGDLMMTMFIFFAMLYVYEVAERDPKEAFRVDNTAKTAAKMSVQPDPNAAKLPTVDPNNQKLPITGPPDPNASGLTPEQILELSERAAKDTNINDVEVVLQDDKTVKISLSGPLLFDLGSAELRSETVEFLGKVAMVLSRTGNEVHVVGHTDNFPIHSDQFPTNWELSVVRASRVARHLIEQGPLAPGRFTVMGNSLYRPIEPNINPESKQKNRRVEIIITRKVYQEAVGF
ncbi:MAG: OmpA family protein [Nitrospirota bacterium]